MIGASFRLVPGSAASCHPVWEETQMIYLLFTEGLCALTSSLTGKQVEINAENYCNLHFSHNIRVMK
jgi:hypothetical protein